VHRNQTRGDINAEAADLIEEQTNGSLRKEKTKGGGREDETSDQDVRPTPVKIHLKEKGEAKKPKALQKRL